MTLSIRHSEPTDAARGVPWGPFAVLTGALLTLAGLWAPWYRLDLPDGFFGGVARQVVPADGSAGSAFFQMFATQIDTLEREGRLQVDAWDVFRYVDTGIAAVAVLAVVALLLTHTGHLTRFPSDAVSLGGILAAGVVIFRIVNPPGPAGILHVMLGAWLCLAGVALMVVGSRLAFRP
ncbi:MAG: hypothetical protein U0237_20675 [Thermoleophilia bacterium]